MLSHDEDNKNSIETFTIVNGESTVERLTVKVFLRDETPTLSCSLADGYSGIKKETECDVICNLVDSICRKQHSHQHHPQQHHNEQNRIQLCDNISTARYILSTIVWNKLNGRH